MTRSIDHPDLGSIDLADTVITERMVRGAVRLTGRAVAIVEVDRPLEGEILDAVAECDHPALLRWHQPIETTSGWMVITDLATGGSLAQQMTPQRSLLPGHVALLVSHIAAALRCLWSAGLVHADVSPANIVIDGGGLPILADLHDCTKADGSILTRGTDGFVGRSDIADCATDATSLAAVAQQLCEQLTEPLDEATTRALSTLRSGGRLGLDDIHELDLVAGDVRFGPNRRTKTAKGPSWSRTEEFGRRPPVVATTPERTTTKRAAAAAVCAAAIVVGAVIWSEQDAAAAEMPVTSDVEVNEVLVGLTTNDQTCVSVADEDHGRT